MVLYIFLHLNKMAFLQAGMAVAQKPSEFANIGFTAIERVLQGIIIFICVILIIVFVSVGFKKSGIICGILGFGGLAGTIYWIHSGGSFAGRAATIKGNPQYYQQRQPYRQQYQPTQRRIIRGRGENEWKFEPVEDNNIPDLHEDGVNKPKSELTEPMEVEGGDDCDCGNGEQFMD